MYNIFPTILQLTIDYHSTNDSTHALRPMFKGDNVALLN